MLKGLRTENIYVVCGRTDMRKSIDGLASIIQERDLSSIRFPIVCFCFAAEARIK